MCYYCGQTDTEIRLMLLIYQWLGIPIGLIILYFFPLEFFIFNNMSCIPVSGTALNMIPPNFWTSMISMFGFSFLVMGILIWVSLIWQFFLDKK
jgi:hypothetical protein